MILRNKEIMSKNIKETEPKTNKFNNQTYIWCVDKLPENYLLEKICTLHSFVHKTDFFRMNKGSVINASNNITSWDTGLINYVPTEYHKVDVVGNRLIVKDGNDLIVYKIVGFNNINRGFLIYLNIK